MPKRLAFLGWLCLIVAVVPLLGLASVTVAAAQDPCEQAGNLTFNCQFSSFGDAPGGQVAQGWWPFVVSGHPAFDQSTESPLAPAQRIWSDGEGFVAGIYQQVTGLTPGATYQAYVGWFVFQSSGPEMGRSIGIDPNGGTDPNSAAIVWGPEVWEKKRLAPELLARAVATGDRVTVFLRVNHPKTYGADQAFVDAVSLVRDDSVPVVGVVPPATETPLPAATEVATATPAIEAATATPEPTATPAPAPTTTPDPTAAPTTTPQPTTPPATAEPTAAPQPTDTPAPAATTEPAAAPTRSVPSAASTVSASSTLSTTAATAAAPTTYDLRGGAPIAQMAFAPAAAPQPVAAATTASPGQGSWWPYALVALAFLSAALYGSARSRTGGRKRG